MVPASANNVDTNMGYRALAYNRALYLAGNCAIENGNPTTINEISDNAGMRFEFTCRAPGTTYRVFYNYVDDISDPDASLIEIIDDVAIYVVLGITVAILLGFGAIINAATNGVPTCFLGMESMNVVGRLYLC
ncbi:MAG: hypothetical protein D6732_11195 [Methanobacteriota archaeon]|nr:MAG: hypothetical protein D6732_11195 [Euryarchaeota archaeon]